MLNLSNIKPLKKGLDFWQRLTLSQRFSFGGLIALVVVLPLTIVVALSPTRPFLRASWPATPPTTPTLTPTPTLNNAPVITTNSLPKGQVGRGYKASIDGYDLDLQDNLSMTIGNLPKELSASCNVYKDGEIKNNGSESARIKFGDKEVKIISCSLKGVPSQAGVYQLQVTLQDDKGGKAEKTLLLEILTQNTWQY